MAFSGLRSLKTFATLTAVAIAATAFVPFPLGIPLALADDGGDGGDGGGGSGGGGDGGGRSDQWQPFDQRSSRQASQRRCNCSFLFICSCSGGTGRRKSTSGTAPAKQAKVAKPTEIVASGLDEAAIATLSQRGFAALSQRQSVLLNSSVVRLAVPEGQSVGRALRTVRSVGGSTALATQNDFYRRLLLAYNPAGQGCGSTCETFAITEWTESVGSCSANARIGIVDTGIDPSHPSLQGAKLNIRSVRSADRPASDTEHGTAVASLLVGQRNGLVAGLAPKAELFAADAFHGSGPSSAADAFDLIAALDWLSDENIKLVNLSLSGPDNALLRSAIAAAQQRGMRLVAAAGKPGQNSDNGFPARYAGVIAVSAVDTRLRPSRHSIRGQHIAFAAPGVGIVVAAPNGKLRTAEGTSFAAPFVTAAFAVAGGKAEMAEPIDTIVRLATTAKDLGAPGRDSIFGWGLIQFAGLPTCDR